MKGLFCACLLAALQSMTAARAYEADIHYSTTYVLARAAGWPKADALTIASANQGVDENQDTVAALELETISGASLAEYFTGSFHQAEKNLRFHCFSNTHGSADRISADVLEIMSGLFSKVADQDETPRGKARKLIALGTALHCQQDAYSHASYGGSCGAYVGSCSGHTYHTLLDQLVFGLLGKHHFNPDHPGVPGHRLLEALQETVRELAARRPAVSMRAIGASEMAALSDALRDSGLELPDDVRRECNRYLAGRWLFLFMRSRSGMQGDDRLQKLPPEVAGACKNPSLASATIVRIPDPRFPRLNADASPYRVRTDGTYQLISDGLISDGTFAAPSAAIMAASDTAPARTDNRRASLQLSHWTQLLAMPLVAGSASTLQVLQQRGNPDGGEIRERIADRIGQHDEVPMPQRPAGVHDIGHVAFAFGGLGSH
jgi:hypothetical protein